MDTNYRNYLFEWIEVLNGVNHYVLKRGLAAEEQIIGPTFGVQIKQNNLNKRSHSRTIIKQT